MPPVPSPCVNICRMDDGTGWCIGCLRSLHEIGAWSGMSDDDKRAIWAALPQRRVEWRLHRRKPAAPADGVPG